MDDNFEVYLRIDELSRTVSEQNINTIPIEDLQRLTILFKDKTQRLSFEIRDLKKEIKRLKSLNSNLSLLEIRDFISIDFETATYNRMACQIGIIRVENLKIVEEKSFYIQPPNNTYDIGCSNVNGIGPSITINSPSFKDLWPDIIHYFNNLPIIAHNASFDMDVLRANCSYYKITLPNLNTYCTCQIHNYLSLSEVCDLYNIEIKSHHDALEDAKACAKIFIQYIKIVNSLKHTASEERVSDKAKKNNDFFNTAARKISPDALKQDLSSVANPDNFFYNKKVVITGIFESFPVRDDLAYKLKELGADVCTSISKKTNIVIYGEEAGPAKLQKVADLQAQGYDIVIIDEEDLNNKLI